MTQIVGVDPSYEVVTNALASFRRTRVYPYLRQRGFGIKRFGKTRARRDLVAAALTESGVEYLTGSGHGLFDSFLGDQDHPIFRVGAYSGGEVQGKIVHLMACLTARSLGADFVNNGTVAFFGYREKFTFDLQNSVPFLECDGEIDRAFADGLTAGEVYRRSYNLFTQRMTQFESQDDDYSASVMEANRDHLCAPTVDSRWGSTEARLVPSRS